MNSIATESIKLPNGTLVVATAEHFWLARGHAFSQAAVASGLLAEPSRDGLRQLLAGCLVAGMQAAEPAAHKPVPKMSAARHLYNLASGYRTAHATPPTMRLVASKFRANGFEALAQYSLEVERDETGHDRMSLGDLRALGVDGVRFVQMLRPALSVALVEHFASLAASPHPVGVFGYAYALERASAAFGQREIDEVEALLPAGVRATRFMRLHSAVGSDARHVEEALDFMATLSAAERATIALAAYSTAGVFGAAAEPLSDEEVLAIAIDCASDSDLDLPWLRQAKAELATA